jgi:membrane-bound metal-dependent hydrolase YbcI (DUF457 family)
MPGYKGHLAGGLFFAVMCLVGAVLIGWLVFDPLLAAGLVGFCLLGALFPDVDTDSKGQNLYCMVLAAVDFGLILQKYYMWAAWLGLLSMFPAMGSHRGWTHTWWAMLIIPLPILLIPTLALGIEAMATFAPFYMAFCVGYFSHLLLDGEFR